MFSISDEKAIMDQHAEFNGEHIDKRGYVGQFCHVESKVNIGELAVVHEYVRLKSDTKVKTTEIYIRTPTSTILYQQCARDISSDEYVYEEFFWPLLNRNGSIVISFLSIDVFQSQHCETYRRNV